MFNNVPKVYIHEKDRIDNRALINKYEEVLYNEKASSEDNMNNDIDKLANCETLKGIFEF